jgi:hypothetical protein
LKSTAGAAVASRRAMRRTRFMKVVVREERSRGGGFVVNEP